MNRLISIAPMMHYTDRHERYFLRLISPHAVLYTEMITTGALIHGDAKRFLQFSTQEHPLALQLGGHDPDKLALCAKMGEDFGYDEINLNVGCPSDRVKSGQFGACLMLEPTLVAECIAAMSNAVKIPVTLKCRIGVDHADSYEALTTFIQCISHAGARIFIIHARKAWLQGLSPKQNREIPPLRYDVVHQIKQDFPHLTIIINGGITTLEAIDFHLTKVDGVMLGRFPYANPYFLHALEEKYFKEHHTPANRFEIIEKLLPYVEKELQKNVKISNITRHILGLFYNQKGGRLWRRLLSEKIPNIDILKKALEEVRTVQE
jgi:tRNA-dihydrouridine synthase A